MAGHSKWANIKRQKARVDAVKGKIFTKISREIIVAAKQGADPEGNFQLRTAIDKAKAAGIPNDNIDRAVAKGSGKWGSENSTLEAIQYEGYGPNGVAILIEALTDNRNRTAADLRAALSKHGGNLGETGCVGWLFDQKGVVTLLPQGQRASIDEEFLLDICIEGGADTYELTEVDEEPAAELLTETTNLEQLSKFCQKQGYQVVQAEFRWIPQNTVEIVEPDQAKQLLKLMDVLEDLDDIQTVTANFEMSDELL